VCTQVYIHWDDKPRKEFIYWAITIPNRVTMNTRLDGHGPLVLDLWHTLLSSAIFDQVDGLQRYWLVFFLKPKMSKFTYLAKTLKWRESHMQKKCSIEWKREWTKCTQIFHSKNQLMYTIYTCQEILSFVSLKYFFLRFVCSSLVSFVEISSFLIAYIIWTKYFYFFLICYFFAT
jgi:hypothetical protein